MPQATFWALQSSNKKAKKISVDVALEPNTAGSGDADERR